MTTTEMPRHPGSFRDPAGFVAVRDDHVLRVVLPPGRDDYARFAASPLAEKLREKHLILPFEEIPAAESPYPDAAHVLRSPRLPLYSFPYEWSVSQLQDAALLTLRILRLALRHGMTLKDASAFNVSFTGARPVFTDLLSFTAYREGEPWAGYLQFCEQFLVPLLLSRRAGRSVSDLLRARHDGIPLDAGARLLRGLSSLRPGQLMHVHLHARSIRRDARRMRREGASGRLTAGAAPKQSLKQSLALVDSLRRTVEGIALPGGGSAWDRYYDDTVYSDAETRKKEDLVRGWIARVSPATVWDLGSNTGRYARLAADAGIPTAAFDADDAVVDAMYRDARQRDDAQLTPLVMNLANPSPALGWAHGERESLEARGPADLVLYLGLMHHLRFTHMVPLDEQMSYLARVARHAVVEWIPREDVNVRAMTEGSVRAGFAYSREGFLSALEGRFRVVESVVLGESGREMVLVEGL